MQPSGACLRVRSSLLTLQVLFSPHTPAPLSVSLELGLSLPLSLSFFLSGRSIVQYSNNLILSTDGNSQRRSDQRRSLIVLRYSQNKIKINSVIDMSYVQDCDRNTKAPVNAAFLFSRSVRLIMARQQAAQTVNESWKRGHLEWLAVDAKK